MSDRVKKTQEVEDYIGDGVLKLFYANLSNIQEEIEDLKSIANKQAVSKKKAFLSLVEKVLKSIDIFSDILLKQVEIIQKRERLISKKLKKTESVIHKRILSIDKKTKPDDLEALETITRSYLALCGRERTYRKSLYEILIQFSKLKPAVVEFEQLRLTLNEASSEAIRKLEQIEAAVKVVEVEFKDALPENSKPAKIIKKVKKAVNKKVKN